MFCIFADVSQQNYEEIYFNYHDEKFKNVSKGINLFGTCECTKCIKYKEEIIAPLKNIERLDFKNELDEIKCPFCGTNIIPTKIGFYCCEYKIKGKKITSGSISDFKFDGKTDKENVIKCLGSEKNEKIPMFELIIETKIIEPKTHKYMENINLLKDKSDDLLEISKINIQKNNSFNLVNDEKNNICISYGNIPKNNSFYPVDYEKKNSFNSSKFISNFDKKHGFFMTPQNLSYSNYNTISLIEEYIGIKLTEQDIKGDFLNDYKMQEIRKEKIQNLCEKLINSKMAYFEYYKIILELGFEIKNDIIFRVFHNPHDFIKIEEIKNSSSEKSPNFIKLVLYTYLNKLGIITCIQKNSKTNNIIASAMLQLISCVDLFQEVFTLKFIIDKKLEYSILNNEKEKIKFIEKVTSLLYKYLEVNYKDIIISNIRKGCLQFDLILLNSEISTTDLREYLQSDFEIKSIEKKSLIDRFYIIDEIFDSRWNRTNGWGINEKRGPPGYEKDYDPPIGYMGFGLNVKDRYDNGNNDWLDYHNNKNEWYIAYHGTDGNAFKGILNPMGIGLKAGRRQKYESSNNSNILNNNEENYKKCGRGVYLTPFIKEAESYSCGIEIKNKRYYLIFMCRVNPKKMRIVEDRTKKDYWIVSGGYSEGNNNFKPTDEVRPYRVLLKNTDNSSFYDSYCFIF